MKFENMRKMKALKKSPGNQFFNCFVVIGGFCGHLRDEKMWRCKEIIAGGHCPKGHTTIEVLGLVAQPDAEQKERRERDSG